MFLFFIELLLLTGLGFCLQYEMFLLATDSDSALLDALFEVLLQPSVISAFDLSQIALQLGLV